MLFLNLAVYAVVCIIILCLIEIYAVIAYIFEARAMYTMAAKRNIPRPWLSYVPVANSWILGKIADDYEERANGAAPRHAKRLVCLKIILLAVLVVFYIILVAVFAVAAASVSFGAEAGTLFSGNDFVVLAFLCVLPVAAAFLYEVFSYIALYKVYRSCSPSKTSLYFTLSVLFGIAPFLMFSVREKTEGLLAGE